MAKKTMTVVLQEVERTVYCAVYSTEAKAQKAVADVIFKRLDEIEDEETKREITQAYEEKEYRIVMQAWNAWSIEGEYNDEYTIETRVVDGELPS